MDDDMDACCGGGTRRFAEQNSRFWVGFLPRPKTEYQAIISEKSNVGSHSSSTCSTEVGPRTTPGECYTALCSPDWIVGTKPGLMAKTALKWNLEVLRDSVVQHPVCRTRS